MLPVAQFLYWPCRFLSSSTHLGTDISVVECIYNCIRNRKEMGAHRRCFNKQRECLLPFYVCLWGGGVKGGGGSILSLEGELAGCLAGAIGSLCQES